MNELKNRIKHDIKQAEARRDAFDRYSNEYTFNHATIIALNLILLDMRELRLTDES